MRHPRIYIVLATFYPIIGGAETQALAQASALRQQGYAVSILTFHQHVDSPAYELMAGVPVIRIAGRLLHHRERLPRLIQKLIYLLALVVLGYRLWQRRGRYDILHVCQLTLLSVPTALVSLLTRKPIVFTLCNSGTATQPQQYASLLAGPLDPTASWLQVRGRLPLGGDLNDIERLGRLPLKFVHALLMHVQAVVIVLSSRMKGYLATHDFDLPHVVQIPNGVDLTRFTPVYSQPLTNEQQQTVVCIARLCYQKGIDVLLQAWRLVQLHAPQARLILVGTGPLEQHLQQMAQALGIHTSVEFAGQQADIPTQLHRGTIAVLPSRIEGLPNALLEAMASGMACVATRVSGSEDLIKNEETGLLVEPEDYQALADALLTLLQREALVQRLGQAARYMIECSYTLEQVTATQASLYQTLCNNRRRAHNQRAPLQIDHFQTLRNERG